MIRSPRIGTALPPDETTRRDYLAERNEAARRVYLQRLWDGARAPDLRTYEQRIRGEQLERRLDDARRAVRDARFRRWLRSSPIGRLVGIAS